MYLLLYSLLSSVPLKSIYTYTENFTLQYAAVGITGLKLTLFTEVGMQLRHQLTFNKPNIRLKIFRGCMSYNGSGSSLLIEDMMNSKILLYHKKSCSTPFANGSRRQRDFATRLDFMSYI